MVIAGDKQGGGNQQLKGEPTAAATTSVKVH